ncbi:MAG: quinolinate synthase NadA [Planctomycetia bacterium]|nr:quinolinate synthase NadA [Planctomycetia bacterium]
MTLVPADSPVPFVPPAALPVSLEELASCTATELSERIETVRRNYGSRLLVLGHHYQSDEVLAHTDLRGDSFQLSREASRRDDVEAILFCGVHFMAETADLLANTPGKVSQRGGGRIPVCLPDLTAGCPMADFANGEQVERCWRELSGLVNPEEITPITYVNSTAEVKSFCGQRNGLACTSSNAREVLGWAFSQRPKVLFVPDQYLGRNTLRKMGVTDQEMILWDPGKPFGGNTPDSVRTARAILWYGHCEVHRQITIADLERVRREHPGVKVGVHPECDQDVVAAADMAGSTAALISVAENAGPGETWAIGTERTLVRRLASDGDGQIFDLLPESDPRGRCRTMSQITLTRLAWCMENLAAGVPVNVVTVPESVAAGARIALERMLAAKP